jgi:hypothetical protein
MTQDAFDKYIKDRYSPQVEWYNKKSGMNKKIYTRFQWGILLISAVIPTIIAYDSQYEFVKHITIGLSIILAVFSAGLKTFKYQEQWLEYRNVAECLIKEKQYLDAELYSYSTKNKFQTFVDRVESIIANETAKFLDAHNKKANEEEES